MDNTTMYVVQILDICTEYATTNDMDAASEYCKARCNLLCYLINYLV